MNSCMVSTEISAMISGRNARNDPNTQASTNSAPSAPISSSVSTLELPEDALPADRAVTPVLCTVAPGTVAWAVAVSWSSTVAGTSPPGADGYTSTNVLAPELPTKVRL